MQPGHEGRILPLSPDGAHLGIMPSRAIDMIVGGAPHPASEEMRSTKEMVELIGKTTIVDCLLVEGTADTASYDATALFAAKLTINALIGDPRLARVDEDEVYWEVKRAATRLEREHCLMMLTGFQWGWAVNAARAVLELEAIANPAVRLAIMRRKVRDNPQA
jgi:hypothetical protein